MLLKLNHWGNLSSSKNPLSDQPSSPVASIPPWTLNYSSGQTKNYPGSASKLATVFFSKNSEVSSNVSRRTARTIRSQTSWRCKLYKRVARDITGIRKRSIPWYDWSSSLPFDVVLLSCRESFKFKPCKIAMFPINSNGNQRWNSWKTFSVKNWNAKNPNWSPPVIRALGRSTSVCSDRRPRRSIGSNVSKSWRKFCSVDSSWIRQITRIKE